MAFKGGFIWYEVCVPAAGGGLVKTAHSGQPGENTSCIPLECGGGNNRLILFGPSSLSVDSNPPGLNFKHPPDDKMWRYGRARFKVREVSSVCFFILNFIAASTLMEQAFEAILIITGIYKLIIFKDFFFRNHLHKLSIIALHIQITAH